MRRRRVVDRRFDRLVIDLGSDAAMATDQELARTHVPRRGTADKRIQRGKLVNQAVRDQEIERPVHSRGRGGAAIRGQNLEDGVRSKRLVALPDDLEHPATQRRQAGAAFAA